MTKLKLDQLARKMYMAANQRSFQYFKKSNDPDTGKVLPWSKLDWEKDMWIEMAMLANKALEKK